MEKCDDCGHECSATTLQRRTICFRDHRNHFEPLTIYIGFEFDVVTSIACIFEKESRMYVRLVDGVGR